MDHFRYNGKKYGTKPRETLKGILASRMMSGVFVSV
jgi:hypothetical protein